MEENTSMFNNKIIGILIAVVVTATVLIPICNAFSDGNGDDGISPLASEVWVNPGTPMSEVDAYDYTQTYSYSVDDGYENDTVLFAWGYEFGDITYWFGIRYVDNYFEVDMDIANMITISWDSTFNMWKIVAMEQGEVAWQRNIHMDEEPKFMAYDPNGTNYLYIGDSLDNIRLGGEYELSITYIKEDGFTGGFEGFLEVYVDLVNNSQPMIEGILADTSGEETIVYEIVSYPEVSIVNGKPTLTGSLIGELDGNRIEITSESLLLGSVRGIIPKTVEIQSDGPTPGSDSGIAGTIIGYIPVFVAVALLGAIVTLFINKKD